jgi:hypothetical protein
MQFQRGRALIPLEPLPQALDLLEAAAGLFELSFSPRHVSQQSVHMLWSQYHESEQKHEQDFRSKAHDSDRKSVV